MSFIEEMIRKRKKGSILCGEKTRDEYAVHLSFFIF